MATRLLENKVTIVTGAAGGLGLGIARRFLAEGARCVYCFDVRPPEAPVPENLMSVEVDIADAAAVDDAVRAAVGQSGHIDVLVCNAAVMQAKCDAVDLDDDEVQRVMGVNFGGVLNCCRSVGGRMRDRGSGRIVTIGSQVAVAPWRGMSAYVASKGAVASFTRALAIELVEHGVFVNCILPGTMDTAQMRTTFTTRAAETGEPVASLIAAKAARMPLGRMGTPEDAAALATWLASDEASFSVGAVFDLTGGELWTRPD
jgi:NAD(P)-dependent dehydrogenase (short-subunit alcohol dehydrogenase family)